MYRKLFFPAAAVRLCCIASALAIASPSPSVAMAAESPVVVSTRARAHFDAALSALKSANPDRFAVAYREFKAAYAISPEWKILGNLGQAAAKLERDGEAVDALHEYIDKGDSAISAGRAAQIRGQLEVLSKGIAAVTLRAPGSFWVVDTRVDDGSSVVNEYGPFTDQAELRVRAGRHEFRIDRATIDAAMWSAPLGAGDTAEHTFVTREPEIVTEFGSEAAEATVAPEAEPEPTHGSHLPSYILWGTGAAAGIAAAVFMVEASRHQDAANEVFRTDCPNGISDNPSPGCLRGIEGDERAAKWRTAALVTGVGALGALAAGTLLYILAPTDSPERAASSVQPWIVGTSVGIKGQF